MTPHCIAIPNFTNKKKKQQLELAPCDSKDPGQSWIVENGMIKVRRNRDVCIMWNLGDKTRLFSVRCQEHIFAPMIHCLPDGVAKCGSCWPGTNLQFGSGQSVYDPLRRCVKNVCTCESGTGADGVNCYPDGVAKCVSCNIGYNLQSGVCVENVCTCESGSEATGIDCLTDGLAKCVSCNSGYDLQFNTCVETFVPSTVQYLMYTLYKSQTIYSYTLDVDRKPLKNGQFVIPFSTDHPGITFNRELNSLEIIGDYYDSSNTNHQRMTIDGSFSEAPDAFYNGEYGFEVAYSKNVGSLVFSGYGHGGSTQVYIITQNSNWNKITTSDKYLAPFESPNPSFDHYFDFGVVEKEDKIYLVGGYTGSYSYNSCIQVVNFANVGTLQQAKSKQWVFMENLKYAITTPAVIHLNDQLIVIGRTGKTSTCQDIQYLNLASNTAGVYADTIDCGAKTSNPYSKRGYYHPGIYHIVGGNVSIFSGDKASKHCMQQTVIGDDLGSKWDCVSSSELALEGLGYWEDGSSYIIIYSNFVL